MCETVSEFIQGQNPRSATLAIYIRKTTGGRHMFIDRVLVVDPPPTIYYLEAP